ncbi:MAG: hypothetical protein H7061_02585 [Bdellovibrionaceae bacterium]|nr:hypothetical protein [Bdellovibrio sp.]
MPDNQKWVFYDSLAKTQSNPMSTEEAQMALFKMRPRDFDRFYIWTAGWKEWQPLSLYLTTDQNFFVTTFTVQNEETVKAKIRDVLEVKPNSGEPSLSFSSIRLDEDTAANPNDIYRQYDGDEISWENIQKPAIDFSKLKKKKADARDTRHELKIEIILISPKGKSFRSKSKNISLSGSLLEDNIPFDYYGITFDIVVVNKDSSDPARSRLSLQGQTVGDGLTQRLQFYNITEEKKAVLQRLLSEYVDQQKKYKKKSA